MIRWSVSRSLTRASSGIRLILEYEGDSSRIWEANIFGKSLHELVNEDLNSKINRMPEDARTKLRETLQRIINEGSGGLICIIL